MPGLFDTLNMASESLFTARQGVDTTGHNIANAQTEGYSRQRVNARARDPSYQRGVIRGNGVFAKDIRRSHNKWVERQLNESSQTFGKSAGKKDALKNLELIFSPEMSAGVNDELNGFFSALQELSNHPDELSARSNVLETGRSLIGSFQRIDSSLRQNRANLNSEIAGIASDVSEKLSRIAELNLQIGTLEVGLSSEANDLRDERDRIVRDISGVMEVHYYEDKQGKLNLRGPGDCNLVDGTMAAKVVAGNNPESPDKLSFLVVDGANGNTSDISAKCEKGRLAGLVQVRDNVIDRLLHENNVMAKTFADSFNQIHRQGYGIKQFQESSGRNFFKVSERIEDAAQSLDLSGVIYDSVDAISAASSPNAPGDNVNINDLVRLKDAGIYGESGATMSEFYANYVGEFGLDVVRSEHLAESDEIVNNDFKTQRESISGVSLDEEATNLMKWQTQFTASSKIVTTADEMLETVLGLKR